MIMNVIFVGIFLVFNVVEACKPVTLIMTRATSDGRNETTGLPNYPLDTVDLANVHGALKFVITETIDKDTGYDSVTCTRKNYVAFVHFYQVTFCNPNGSLWWFNPSRPSGVGGKPTESLFEYGGYLTADAGICHDNDYCHFLHGNETTPKLGSWVGFQNVSTDIRNPTSEAYWYSIMGGCPLQPRSDKTSECLEENPTGRCADGKEPDGDSCTWKYEYLGQVEIDELVGIKDIVNDATGKNFTSSTEYCKAGLVEFSRDQETYDFKEGLPFWENPLDQEANERRIQRLLEVFSSDPLNTPMPEITNPQCYENVRQCGDGNDGTRLCKRDSSQMCVFCSSSDPECVAPKEGWELDRAPELSAPELPAGMPSSLPEEVDGSGSSSDSSSAVKQVSSVILSSTILLGLTCLAL